MRFTDDVRARFVGLIEAGSPISEAAGRVGVSERTVHTWLARGRREAGTPAAEFAVLVDAHLQGAADERLSEADVLRLVERAARKGSVAAMKMLLERFEKEKRGDGDETEKRDPLAEFDELAQRRRSV